MLEDQMSDLESPTCDVEGILGQPHGLGDLAPFVLGRHDRCRQGDGQHGIADRLQQLRQLCSGARRLLPACSHDALGDLAGHADRE